MRPSKIKNYMDVAIVIAERSHDTETHVGAVLINNKSGGIISTGFNGFLRGADDASLPNTRPLKYEVIIHAEANLLTNCCRHGISTEDCTLICTMSPCSRCMRLLISAGITKVIARELYKDFNDILAMPDVSVSVKKEEDGYFHITYTAGK